MAERGTEVTRLVAGLARGDRRALARAITLTESTRADHRAIAEALLGAVYERTGRSLRLGISGAPGVGKSTFIEAFGLAAVAAGKRPAVLAIDPSSELSGGSLLGDKTRMAELAQHKDAFIRPSPAGRRLGGVARRTREAIWLAEAAGFDLVIVETVGVGQAETEVRAMVDFFMLLVQPAGGDELQGLKRGIVELADLVLVTKADGELAAAAGRAAGDYRRALRLLNVSRTAPEVLPVSAREGRGIAEVLALVERRAAAAAADGSLARRRREQAQAALWSEIGEGLVEALKADAAVAASLPLLEARVATGALTPSAAARQALACFRLPA